MEQKELDEIRALGFQAPDYWLSDDYVLVRGKTQAEQLKHIVEIKLEGKMPVTVRDEAGLERRRRLK